MKKQQNKIDLYLCYITLFFYIVFGNILNFNLGNRMPVKVADFFALILIGYTIFKYKKIRLTRINRKILIFIIIGIVSLLIYALIHAFAIKDLVYCLLYPIRLLFYLILCNTIIMTFKENKIKLSRIINFAIICFSIVGIFGIIQLILYPNAFEFYDLLYKFNVYHPNPDPHIDRMFSTYLDPNYFGACMLLPLSLSLVSYIKKKNILYFFSTLLFLICIIYSNSRSAFLGLLIISLIICSKYFRFSKEKIKQNCKILIYCLIIFSYIFYAMNFSKKLNVINRIGNTIEDTVEVKKKDKKHQNNENNDNSDEPDEEESTMDESTSARFESWGYSLSIFKDNWIIGIGYNSIGMVKHDTTLSTSYGVDSSLLLIIITTGIVGAIYISFNILKLLIELFFDKSDSSAAIMAFIIASLIVCNFNNVLFYVLWFIPSVLVINACFELKENKKIAIDARMINSSGIGVYIQNLMKNKCYDIALGDEKEIRKIDKDIKVINYNSNIYGIKEQLKFPDIQLMKENIDVLHVPHYNVPILYSGEIIVTIHDLTHIIYPEFLKNKLAFIYAKIMLKIAAFKSSKILTVSENTKNDIVKYLRVNKDKIKVIYNGVGEEFVKKNKKDINYLYKKYNIPKNKKLLMYVGNLKPHKNLNRLLEALSKIKNKKDYCLLLVGKAFNQQVDLEEIENRLGLDNVIHTGMVTQEELVDLYNLVDLFVFPSLYEGFGLPVLESLRCGTPVIASNSSSIPEVGGKIIGYFDPEKPEMIAKEIEKHINDKEKINNKKINDWCDKFSWENASIYVKKELDRL